MPTRRIAQHRGPAALLALLTLLATQASCSPIPAAVEAAELEPAAVPPGGAVPTLGDAPVRVPWVPPAHRFPESPLEGVLALPPGTLPPASLSPKGDLGDAVARLKRGDLSGARHEVDAYLNRAATPEDKVFGLFVLAHIEEADGAPARAAQTYASIRNSDLGLRSEIARGEGRALARAGDPLQGARRFQAGADALPDSPMKDEILTETADAWLAAGHPVTASKIYEELAPRLSGEDAERLTLKLAQTRLVRGLSADAVEDFDRLNATAESCAVADEAGAALELAAHKGLRPEPSVARDLARAERATRCARWPEASALLKALTGRADANALEEGWLRLWYARWDIDQVAGYTAARLKEPLDDVTRSRLTRWAAKAAWRAGDASRAADLRMAGASLGDRTPSSNDRLTAGLMYMEAHAFAQGRALLEQVLTDDPSRQTRIDSLWYLAWASLMERKDDEAERRLADIITRYGDDERGRAALYWTGRLDLSRGRGDKALESFRALEERDPDSFYTFLVRSLHLKDAASSPEISRAPARAAPTLVPRPGRDLPAVASAPGDLLADLPTAGSYQALPLPSISPMRTVWPSRPDISSTPFLSLPSPLKPEAPIELAQWQELGRVALDALTTTYGAVLPELKIAQSLARAGFRHQASAWIDRARRNARESSDSRMRKLSGEREKLHLAYWYTDSPLEALRLDPTSPFPALDVADPVAVSVWQRRYPRVYAPEVSRSHFTWGVDPSLIYGIMRTESMFGSDQVSAVGARGLMQIMPATGGRIADLLDEPFDVDLLFEPGHNVWYGTWYLARLLERFNGQLPLAIAAYNAGPNYVGQWARRHADAPIDVFIEEIPIRQTRNYVKKVMRAMSVYRDLYGHSEGLPLRAVVDGTETAGVDF